MLIFESRRRVGFIFLPILLEQQNTTSNCKPLVCFILINLNLVLLIYQMKNASSGKISPKRGLLAKFGGLLCFVLVFWLWCHSKENNTEFRYKDKEKAITPQKGRRLCYRSPFCQGHCFCILPPSPKAYWPHRQTSLHGLCWRNTASGTHTEPARDLSAPCDYSVLSI